MTGLSLRHYLSLVKFSHTVFALPFALVGFAMGLDAEGQSFHWSTALLVLACMVLARTAAMAFNRWADRHLDALNERTRQREIPSGIISAENSLRLVIISSLLFVICTAFINSLCFYLSPLALAVILGYSYTKRFTSLSHFILGLGLSFAPLGAFMAVTARLEWMPVVMALAVLCWVSGFDILYAMQDIDFDRRQQLYSIPARLGIKASLKVARSLHLMSSLLLLVVYLMGHVNWLYLLAWIFFSAMLIYQHLLLRPDDLSRLNTAFFTANSLASLFFGLLATAAFLL
jgi:4-hydroxybenzoate polyprenyltransferase